LDHVEVGQLLHKLGENYLAQGDFAKSLNTLGRLYRYQGRYAEAEPLYKRSLAIGEEVLGSDHPGIAAPLNNLAALYETQGRYAEAEPLYKRSLFIWEKASGVNHPRFGMALNNLARLYRIQGRYAEAEPLAKRSLAIRERALGTDHLDVSRSLENLADLYETQGRYAEAEPLYKRSLAIREKVLGLDHLDVGQSLNGLAGLYVGQRRYLEAEPLYQRVLAIWEKALGPEHPWVGTALNNLANLHSAQRSYAEAEPLFQRSLAIVEKALGPDHPDVGASLNNMAALAYEQRDWQHAVDYWRRSVGVLKRRAQRGTVEVGQALAGKKKGEAEQQSFRFWGLIKAAYRLEAQERSKEASQSLEMFETAQWTIITEAAASLAQMAARGAKGDLGLAALVRERQDMVEEWQKRDRARIETVSQASDRRDRAAETVNVARLAVVDTRIAEIDKRMVAEFPDYEALARPRPVSVQEVQAQIGADEALVLFLDTAQSTPEETFIWVVTKTDIRWMRSDLGTRALNREVAALRCGLDAAFWDSAAALHCADLLNAAPQRDAHGNVRWETLPFDAARAHALYKQLFGQVEDLIRDKHLLIVPSGPLTQLPFQVLITAPASGTDHRTFAWLTKAHAITVLPAVSSLKALRRVAKPSAGTRVMLGIGNPLLDGDPVSRPWEAQWAKLAQQKQACGAPRGRQVASLMRRPRVVLRVATRGGRADLDYLRSQSPLHETADELSRWPRI